MAAIAAPEVDTPVRKKPGPRPGSRHSGMFKPGHQLTRPPVKRNLMERAAEIGHENIEEIMQMLLDEIRDKKNSLRLRLTAMEMYMNRTMGSPVSVSVHQDITDRHNGSGQGLINGRPADKPAHAYTKAELEKFIAETRELAASDDESGDTIDAVYTEVDDSV